MEKIEGDLPHHKNVAEEGYSEEKLDKQVDLLVKTKTSQVQGVHVFSPKKKSQTVFQAQNEEEK